MLLNIKSRKIYNKYLPVYISGAGTSIAGPRKPCLFNFWVNRRVTLSISQSEYFLESIVIPALAPPNGTSTTEHFQVIKAAKALTSSISTSGAYLIPPLVGRRWWEC